MINAGMGPHQINTFLAGLDIHPVHQNTYKKREEEIEKHFEEVAKTSCAEALEEEIRLMKELAEKYDFIICC